MSFRQTIRRFYEPALANVSLFVQTVVQALCFALSDVFTILVFKWMATYAEQQNVAHLSTVAYVFLFVTIAYIIRKYYMRHRGWAMYYRFKAPIFNTYMSKFFQLDYTTIEKHGTGRLVYMLGKGSDEWVEAIIDSTYSFIDVFVKLLFFFVMMFLLNIWYGVGFVGMYIVMIIAVYYINKGTLYRRKKRIHSEELISKQLVRMIMSKQEVLQSHKIHQEVDCLLDQNQESHIANIKVNNYIWAMFNIPLLMLYVAIVVILFHTVTAIKEGTFVFADFVVITTMIGYLMASVLRSTEVFKNVTKKFSYIERIWKFFDTTKIMTGYAKGKLFVHSMGSIHFDHVFFSYNKGTPLLSDFSCTIQGGKKTAFVGVSGGGKSTLIKLIAGYLSPDAGFLSVDGQDLSNIALKTYYPHIGYLTQDPSVFDGTVYDNLIYALDTKPSDAQLQKAIRDAGCDFVTTLPDGLQTEIGERGVRLSGGQRQRLAIARIFLKDPEIVLLDEPTSALDSLSEEKISQALHTLFLGRTVLVVAHRLQTVKEADDIIVIDNGQLVERGTHAQLVKKKGSYAKMLELQTTF